MGNPSFECRFSLCPQATNASTTILVNDDDSRTRDSAESMEVERNLRAPPNRLHHQPRLGASCSASCEFVC